MVVTFGVIITHINTHTYKCMYIYAYIHTNVHTYICMYVCTHVSTHECMYTYIHTHTHTYIHTYICMTFYYIISNMLFIRIMIHITLIDSSTRQIPDQVMINRSVNIKMITQEDKS